MTKSAPVFKYLFNQKPIQWGLRGDPYLWEAMNLHFEREPFPESEQILISLIESAFESITGHPISTKEHFHVKAFSHGRMSSGYVSPEFWREKAILHLVTQYRNFIES